MADHPIQGLMKTTMEQLSKMVDVSTIVGDPIETPDGSVILPISKVGFGFAAGGSDFEYGHQQGASSSVNMGHPFGGGSGGGVSITPVAFLVVGKQGIRSIPLESSTHLYDRILESVPQFVEKIQGMFSKNQEQPVTNVTDAKIVTNVDEHDLEELIDRS